MSCENNYFVGQGSVMVRRIADNCGDPTEGWFDIGEAEDLSIANAQSFNTHNETRSGLRKQSARWLTGTEATFTMAVNDFVLETLAVLLQGTQEAAVAAGTETDESVPNCYEGQVLYTAYPGISSVSVKEGATPLVLDTDYTIDSARDGGIAIITGAPNISGPGPITLLVTYDHVGIAGKIKALTTPIQDYEIRFNAINQLAPNTPHYVLIHRAQINAGEELSLISEDMTSLSMTGAILPDSTGEYYTIVEGNAVE